MLRAVIIALLVLGLTAPQAVASVAGSDGTTIVIAGGDEASDISFPTTSFSDVAVEDLSGITATDGCTQREPTVVTCPGTRIEAALGGGDDRWSDSSATSALIDAGPGDDTVLAGQFDDVLIGGEGDDELDGDSENDVLQGGPGADTLYGDDADDELDGGAGSDRLNGDGPTGVLTGNDTLNAADGEQDLVDCNFGADAARVDAIDTVANCESVETVGGGGPGPSGAQLEVSVPRSVARTKFANKGVAGTLETSESGTLAITLSVTASQARKAGVGRKAVSLTSLTGRAQGGPAAFRVVPARRFRAKLRQAQPFKATVSVVFRSGTGATKRATRTVSVG